MNRVLDGKAWDTKAIECYEIARVLLKP